VIILIEKVDTGTFEMNYFKFGSGSRTLVILPGLSIQSVMGAVDAVLDEYAVMLSDFTVYLFDRREELPDDYTVRDMARDTADAIRKLGLRDIFLYGVSQGGMIAMVIALRYPELVKKLALGSTSARVDEKNFTVLGRWIEFAKKRDGVALYLDFAEKVYPADAFAQYKDALITAGKNVADRDFERFIKLAEGTFGFDIEDELQKIQCPVLAIGSSDDLVFGDAPTKAIAERLHGRKDFEMYIYNGYGHAAYDTAPDYRERIYSFFIKQTEKQM